MKYIFIPILVIILCLSNFGCVSNVSSRHLENIVATEQLILNEIKDIKSGQLTQISEDMQDIVDATKNSDAKLDKLLEEKSEGDVKEAASQLEIRVYIISDKWKVWRYCTNIDDAISFLNQYK